MSNKTITIYAEALKRRQEEEKKQPTGEITRESTRVRDESRDIARDNPRDKSRDNSSNKARETSRNRSRTEPTRDEIQEFSFRLRDELKVKIQAEVPHLWQKELEEMAQKLNVRKLELYRFIIGEFLGKVQRKDTA